MNFIKDHYNNIPVYVTENGLSDNTGVLDDQARIDFYRAYIDEVLKGTLVDYVIDIVEKSFNALLLM